MGQVISIAIVAMPQNIVDRPYFSLPFTLLDDPEYLVEGLAANRPQIQHFLENSLMLVTALNPAIGYDRAAQVAKKAYSDTSPCGKPA